MGRFFRRRLPAAALALAVCFMFGCSSAADPLNSLPSAQVSMAGEAPSSGAQIALVTTEARLQSTFGQAVWNAVVRFSGEKGATKGYYIAEAGSEEAAQNALELAVRGGAELVLSMDDTITKAANTAAGQNSAISFVLMDCGEPMPARDNVTELRFSPAQAGWLAGYTAVYEEQENLGVVQESDTNSALYALGFALGADYAAAEQGLDSLRLVWAHAEQPLSGSPALLAAEVLESGAALVFAAVPPEAQQEVLAVVQAAGGKLFGIGLALAGQGASALASLDFEPRALLLSVLESWHSGNFGGRVAEGQAADGAIVLNVEVSRFTNAREWTLSQGALRIKDQAARAQLAEATAMAPLPGLDELALAHVAVFPPGPPSEAELLAGGAQAKAAPAGESLPPESASATAEATA